MVIQGHVQNGVVVFDSPANLPDGTVVRVEVVQSSNGTSSAPRRQGGQYAGQIWIAPDFDQWPDDMKEALGMK